MLVFVNTVLLLTRDEVAGCITHKLCHRHVKRCRCIHNIDDLLRGGYNEARDSKPAKAHRQRVT